LEGGWSPGLPKVSLPPCFSCCCRCFPLVGLSSLSSTISAMAAFPSAVMSAIIALCAAF